jgi:hypothetical protein
VLQSKSAADDGVRSWRRVKVLQMIESGIGASE